MKVKSKIWLEEDNKLVVGEGKLRLLKEIKKTGSINKAAMHLNMSYRKAWSHIKAIEDRLNYPIVYKKTGGKESGTTLTKEGEELIRKYEKLIEGINDIVDERFRKIFY